MSTSAYDSYRPPEPPRRRRRRERGRTGPDGQRGSGGQGPGGQRGGRRGAGGMGDGSREMAMVPEPEFSSYYGRPIVKAPPWEDSIAIYLFLGGVAGGSALLGLGGQITGRPALRRNGRLAAITSAGLGAVALISDLGRPERFANMLRVVKLSSPMSVGTWILSGFSAAAGIAAAAEVDRMTGSRLPLGPLRPALRAVAPAAGGAAALAAAPLSVYTAVLFSDTAVPTWNAAREDLPFVFGASACMASSGLALVTTPVSQAGPARVLAGIGAAADVIATRLMEDRMDPVAAEPLQEGVPGRLMRWSERLAVAGGIGALLGGRHRVVAAASGVALLGASALARFGILHAGLNSAKDPRYTVEPQKRRLRRRREAGMTDDSITTAG